jgi:hypothetical protein
MRRWRESLWRSLSSRRILRREEFPDIHGSTRAKSLTDGVLKNKRTSSTDALSAPATMALTTAVHTPYEG